MPEEIPKNESSARPPALTPNPSPAAGEGNKNALTPAPFPAMDIGNQRLLDSADPALYEVTTRGHGPRGRLPFTPEMLRERPSGDLFGMTEDAGMGWEPSRVAGPQFVLLSNLGGIRRADGRPTALGWHTGHFELGLALEAAADTIRELGGVPYAGHCTDPCDGRTQGTTGMFDSLAYRNDAATIFRRLVRSIPTARGVLGAATCDKGLPAMMMALASFRQLPCVLVPGGVTLPTADGEDTGKVQSVGARFARGEIALETAAEVACRTCASSGGGCHFFGTAASSQVVGEAMGLALPHSALAPSGQPIWLDMARRSARALVNLAQRGLTMADIVTEASIRNAMAVHSAAGGSTNLLLHLPAIAHAAGLPRPTVADWAEVNRRVPRLLDVLPNGPRNHPTLFAYLAGGVPEIMLHLRDLGVLALDALTVSGQTLADVLQWWERSPRRQALHARLREKEGIEPAEVIFSPQQAETMGVASTVCFPRGNLAPEGSAIKSTAIDPRVLDADGVYRHTGPARVFVRETDAMAAIKGLPYAGHAVCGGGSGQGSGVNEEERSGRRPNLRPIQPGDVLVLIGRGPLGSGMEEIYQVTAALRYLSFGHEVAVVTDARFSGVSTGACVGLVGPEALAGGPIGRVREGDRIRIVIDRRRLEGSVDLVGDADRLFTPEEAARVLAERSPHPDLSPDPFLPPETRLWAALQQLGGGAWGGAVYDVDRILAVLEAGRTAVK